MEDFVATILQAVAALEALITELAGLVNDVKDWTEQ